MAKLTTIIGAALSLAVVARTLVLPEPAAAGQRPLHGFHDESTIEHVLLDDDPVDRLVHTVETIRGQIHGAIDQAVASFTDGSADSNLNIFDHPGIDPNLTIYELISKSKFTTKFAKLVNGHPNVVDLLNGTSANHTLFVPIDEAFRHIPDDHKDLDNGFIENLLLYHVGLGEYSAGKIFHTYTIPTAYDEKALGGEPQRLRTSIGLGGIKINLYSKVVATDISAKNGVIHAVNHILVPPPSLGRIISLFPSRFSTLSLAYEKTDFVKVIHGINVVGSTVFAPTNEAFAWLGPKANAFLFNTAKGGKYLKAILKYHIVPNATLYTDAFYDKRDDGEKKSEIGGLAREHYDLSTLLGDEHISVDIARVFGFASMRVNAFSRVILPNGVGRNGVLQGVNRVLLPPCKGHQTEEMGEIDIEDLMSRLEDYV